MGACSLTGEEHVHELAVRGAAAHLLDLGEAGVERLVDPGQHVVPGQVVRRHRRRVHVHRHPAACLLSHGVGWRET